MNIACMVDDNELFSRLQNDSLISLHPLTKVRHVADMAQNQANNAWDAVILSDRFFPLAELGDCLEQIMALPQTPKVIVLLSNHHDSVLNDHYMKCCLSHRSEFVTPGLTVPAIVTSVRQILFGKGDGKSDRRKIVLFVGTTPNIGTTAASFGTAAHLAKATRQSVGYLCLNLKSSKLHRYLGRDHPAATLDLIRAELKGASLTGKMLLQYCDRFKALPNLHVLYGNMLREQAEFFSEDDIEHLLRTASDVFDICIVETNAYWDNAATVCGAHLAGTKILVTTPQVGHFQEDMNRWLRDVAPVAGIDPAGFDVLVTQRPAGAEKAWSNLNDIRRETGLNIIGEIGKYNEIEAAMNQGRLLEFVLGNGLFQKDMRKVVYTLERLYGLERIKEAKDKRSWRKWLSFRGEMAGL
ncbi:MAG TPA: hypothetical protein VF260_09615 [Bacilli bacterium]